MIYKNKIIFLVLLVLICLPFLIFAFESGLPFGDVYLRAHQLDWNTFNFEPRLNNLEHQDMSYIWEFSDGYKTTQREFIRTFEKGDYIVKLTAVDYYGRYYTQTAKLHVAYWTIMNKWFWGILYLIVLLLIVYYWMAKLIYMANEKIIREHVEAFLESLDDVHFWKNLAKAIKSKR